MKTDELVGWLGIWRKVSAKDSWDNLQEDVYQEIIKRLEELEELKESRDKLLKAVIDVQVIFSEVMIKDDTLTEGGG